MNLEFKREWDGRYYGVQQVAPIGKEETDKTVVITTQPQDCEEFKRQHGSEAKEQLYWRLASVIVQRGTLDLLRRGIKDAGCKFQLAYLRPSSGLNEALQRLYLANLFSVVRQLHYSERNDQSIDPVFFLDGLPLFTAEIKDPLTGQNVEDAVRQYRFYRNPKGPSLPSGAAWPISPSIPTWSM